MELDLHQLIRIARRRWWIVVLLTLVAGGAAFYNVSREIPLYRATATMIVNPGAITGSDTSFTSIYDTERLAATYVQLVNTQAVRDRVEASFDDDRFPGGVSATAIPGTLLIQVSAVSDDPALAVDTANAYVDAFRDYIDDQNADRIDQSRASVDAQISYLLGEIEEIDARLETATDEARIDLQQQRQTYVNMVSQLETDAARSQMQAVSASTFVEGVDSANFAFQISPNVQRSTMLGLFVGVLLAVGVIALLEFLDNTVKGYTNIQDLTQSHLLASIPVNTGIKRGTRQVFVMADPQSGSAEAIRLLRTNLSFAGVDSPISSIAITSSIQSEGKSTVAANLAVAVANSGMAVALVDADLRKPTQYEIFGVDGRRGVTSYVADRSLGWEDISQRVAVPGLVLIPSGPIPPNPAEMVTSARFKDLLQQLRSEFDLVIVDTPPILQASDGLMAGSLTDGLLVVSQHGRTRVDALKSSAALIHQSGTRLIGVVLNRAEKGESGYYGEYYGTYGRKQ